jgi:hypothetical protein
MIQTENRLIEDIESLKHLFKPERALNYLVALAGQELSIRLRQMDGKKLEKIASRLKEEMKDRPVLLGVAGLAAAGIAFYGRRALVESLKEKPGIEPGGLPLKSETVQFAKSEVACPDECASYEI